MNEEIRALFPIVKDYVYLNHAAVSPPPAPVIEAVNAQLMDVQLNGSVTFGNWLATKERARKLLAQVIGAERPSQIAFMRNTSDALSTVANGMRWQTGDNLVSFANEFPSNIYPWKRLEQTCGVEVRLCRERDGRVDLGEMESLIDARTRLVAISYVQYASGFRADVKRLAQAARAVDALLVIDVIQAAGVMEINVADEMIDAAAGAGHKWLMCPEGIGYLYLSERARARIEPTLVGWVSVADTEDLLNFEQDWKPDALAWETGTFPSSLIYGLEASLKFLTGVGIARIAAYLEMLTDYLCESLDHARYEIISPRAAGEKSHIVCIKHRGGREPMELYRHLKSHNIITSPRNDRLRISPHIYNTREDIDALLAKLPE